jgi:hypothetical protein
VGSLRWALYYLGRFFQLLGLVVVTNGLLLHFGDLRPLFYYTAFGGLIFFFGWLAARRNPEAK